MNDRELEARLRAWYGDEVGEAETAPVSLRRDVAAIPRTGTSRSRRFGRGLTLLAAAALLLVGGALAAGSGLLRVPSVVPPEPVPSLAAVATPSQATESSTPTAVTSPAPTGAPSPVPGPAGLWVATGSMGTPRSGHTAVRLLDGRVLVVGGADGDENDTSAELYDPTSGTWSSTGDTLKYLAGFPATLLRDGRVLVGDGDDPNSDDEARWNLGAEVYDPASGTWTATGKMSTPTKGAAATLLRDGTVLVTGTDGAQLYDPDSGTWTATGRMPQRHEYHAAVLLADGRVLVAGGYVFDEFGFTIDGIQESVELYDPATGTWAATAPMSDPRNPIALTLLPDGKVLATGGWPTGADQPLPELYDPATGTWTPTGSMVRPRTLYGSATLLSDGTVLVMGGSDAELHDPDTGSWTTTTSMLQERFRLDATPTLLLDGTVLVAGGYTASAELYVPAGVTPPSGLPTSPPPTPTAVPTAVPTPFPPEAGPVPPGARSWKVTVFNNSSEPATLFVAEENEQGLLGRLVGSATPNVVAAGATVKVTFLLPAKGTDWAIFVNPGPNDGPLVGPAEMSLAGQIRIAILSSGQPAWASP